MSGVSRAMFDFLRGDRAFALRREHATRPGDAPPDPVALANALRRASPTEEARALAEQIELERRAWSKFEDPRPLLFDRVGLEQASSRAVAAIHASLFPAGADILDLGCGLGADAIAFGRRGLRVIGVERDASRARLANYNVRADFAAPFASSTPPSPFARVVVGDATRPPASAAFAFADPDRRASGRRTVDPGAGSPSLESLLALRPRFEGLAIKLSSATRDADLPADAAVDFISEDGICKEALLSWGLGRGEGERRAVLAATGEARCVEPAAQAESVESGAYLFDPDPALVRAGGVDALAREIDARRAHPGVAYLFGDHFVHSPWIRAYRVLNVLPFRAREVVRFLAEEPPRTIVVKSRGFDPEGEKWRRVIPRNADGPVRVLVAFARGASRVVAVCAPADEALSS